VRAGELEALRARIPDPPKALILDLGNVLIFHDNEQLVRELGAACGRAAEEVRLLIGRANAGERINVTDASPEFVYEVIAPAIGFPGGFADFAAIWNGIFTPYAAMVPLIAALRGRVGLSILSNTNPLHMAAIRPRLPVLRLFDAVLTSYELGLMKPDRRIYARALAVAGVAAHEAAFFDDLPSHVAGAAAVGMRAFLFTDATGFVRDLAAMGLSLDAAAER